MRDHDEASKILLKIEELTKTLNKGPRIWNDHLAKYLDEYVACVEDMSGDDTRGVMAISFVQAGRMLESSSKVYATNVDYLWQFMTEVMEVLRMNRCSKNNAKRSETCVETADSSENHEESPQKRRKRAVFKDFEEIVVNVIDPDMKVTERNELIKPLPLQHVVTKPDWKWRKSSYKIVDVDGDTVVPSDYSVMLQTSRDGKLQMNMLKEVISECSEVPTSQQSTGELIRFLELLIKELSHGDTSRGSNDDPTVGNPLSQGTTSEYACTELPEPPVPLSLPVTPPTSPEPATRSASDVETPERIKRSLSEAGSEKEVCAAAYSARRSGEKEHIVTVLEDSLHEKPLKRRQVFNLPGDLKMLKSDGRKRKSGHALKMELIIKHHGTEVLRTYVKEALFPLCADFKQFYLGHVTEKLLLQNHPKVFGTYQDREDFFHRLSKEYDEDFFGFEDYESGGEEEEEEEEEVDRDDFFCHLSKEYGEDFHGFKDYELGGEDEEEEEEEFRGWPHAGEDVRSQDCDCNRDRSVAVPLPVAVSRGDGHNVPSQTQCSPATVHEDTEADIARRVAEWECYIRPKLKVARDRGHFDIHKVGTEILKSFPQSSARVTLQFEQFAADKPMADIPRYFLASLQLANTHNIEISQSASGDLPMDCMYMTLLSPVRHHEVLQDYEAPSKGAKHKHVNQGVESNVENGDKSSSRSVGKKKHKHVIRDAAINSSDWDRSWCRSMSKKKHRHVSQVAASNSDDGDSSLGRSMCKKKHKHVNQDSASSSDGGESSLIRIMSKKKRKRVSRVVPSNSDTDGDSSPSRSVCKQKRNKR